MFCTQCGNEVEPQARFCSKCGSEVAAAARTAAQAQAPAPLPAAVQPRPHDMNMHVTILAWLLMAHFARQAADRHLPLVTQKPAQWRLAGRLALAAFVKRPQADVQIGAGEEL